MKKIHLCWAVVAAFVMTLTACEKMVLDEEGTVQESGNVTIRTSIYQIVSFDDTRAVQNMADYSSTINFVFYRNGDRVKTVTQKKGESGFGNVSVTLAEGTYQLLVLAHSCPFGNPTMSSPSYVHFTNSDSGYSDTFFYYGDLDVTEEPATHDLTLHRATSMLRITITDAIPSNVDNVHFFFKGESGVFDATTGFGGSVNSEQQMVYSISGLTAPVTLRLYTFLRAETGSLKSVQITARTSNKDVVAEKELVNVPMKYGMVTDYTGTLFSSSSTGLDFTLTGETDWEVYEEHTF